MGRKYVVGTTEGEVFGCYYGETGDEAIEACRTDHHYLKDGRRIDYRTGRTSLENLRTTLIAVEQ